MTISKFRKTILDWYKKNRRDLPWRNTTNPYKILVSEVMLQQTQVSRVIPKYKEFLKEFPTLEKLAKAQNKKLLKVWAGLGYWRRALRLKEMAQKMNFENVGGGRGSPSEARERGETFSKIPFSKPSQLERFPGIGSYTARAVACFAFGSKEAFLDTNIRRVYLHFFFPKLKNVSDKEILGIAQQATSHLYHGKKLTYGISPKEWHYALFDYGAQVLKDKKINKRSKHYHKQGRFEGSFRFFRTATVRFLLSKPRDKTTSRQLISFLQNLLAKVEPLHRYKPEHIISSLLKDRLIKKSKHYFTI